MKSTDVLKRKVDDLQKQAEEIEELGIKILEEADYSPNTEHGGFFFTLDYRSPLKKVQHEAILKYQQWYSTSLQLVVEYTQEWLNDFKLHYTRPNTALSIGVMEYLNLGVSTRFSDKEGAITEFVDELGAQVAILLSIPHMVEVKETGLRKLITADVARTEIEQAEILLDSGFERAAGSVAGVALELHLKTLCDVNGVSYPPKPTIETLVQALYKEKKIDITELKQIQYLGSIRNKCAHPEPVSANEVQSLIDGVKNLYREEVREKVDKTGLTHRIVNTFDILRNLRQKSRMRLLKNVEGARYNHEYEELLVRLILRCYVAGVS